MHGRNCSTTGHLAFLKSLGLMCALVTAAPICLADNPIIQTKFTADPAPMVYDNTLYLYTSHDEDDASGFTMYNWCLYSTTDMVNWTDHGIVAGVVSHTNTPTDTSLKTFQWADGVSAWAPQAVYRSGKFYLYVPFSYQGSMIIGVAVADRPEGPFKDPLGKPLIGSDVGGGIDPTAFVDGDSDGGTAQAYLYWGNPIPKYVLLNSDMISYSGSPGAPGNAQHYQEGPWFYKRNGNYYLAYASSCCAEGIGYAMSTSPTGPWTNPGSGYVMMPDNNSSGNHPGIIDYLGQSYVFGFNYYLNDAMTKKTDTGPPQRRSVNVSQFTYNADGTIPTVPWFDPAGVPQVGHLNPYTRVEAETIAWESGVGAAECSSNTNAAAVAGSCWAVGVKTEVCSDTGGGMDVTSIQNGSYIKVKGVDFGVGAESFSARVASSGSGGSIEIRLDSGTGPLAGTVAVTGTGGAQTWVTQTTPITGVTGVHDLYFVFTGAGASSSLFNFNYWQFTPRDAGDAGGTDAGTVDASANANSDGSTASGSSSGSGGPDATGSSGMSQSGSGSSGTSTSSGSTSTSSGSSSGSGSSGASQPGSGSSGTSASSGSTTTSSGSSSGSSGTRTPGSSGMSQSGSGSSGVSSSSGSSGNAASGTTPSSGSDSAGSGCGCHTAGSSWDSPRATSLVSIIAPVAFFVRRRRRSR